MKWVNTPFGNLNWCSVNGKGVANYNEDGFQYQATIYLKGEDAKQLIDDIDEVLGKPVKGSKIKSLGYHPICRDKKGKQLIDEDGSIIYFKKDDIKDLDMHDEWAFQFKTGVEFADGNKKQIDIFDSEPDKGPIDFSNQKIGNGSIGSIQGLLKRWERKKGKKITCGVSLFLNKIQITELVPYSADAGFKKVDGYVSQKENKFTAKPTEENTGSNEKPVNKPRTRKMKL